MPDFATIEEAQEYILQQSDTINGLQAEVETLRQEKQTLTEEKETLRNINQRYYNRLIQQEAQEDPEQDEPETVPTCEEFAKSIII